MSIIRPHILKFANSPKTRKSKYLDIETFFFLQKILFPCPLMTVILQKNSFPTDVTFKITRKEMSVLFVDFKEYLLNICSIFAH